MLSFNKGRCDKVKQKVLVVFENEEAYRELQSALESTTVATVFAITPDEAIRLFVNHEYCLVIMDASVSDADGQRLLKIMQTIQPTPILLLSSNTEYPDRLAAFNSGANAYLGKPYSLEECVAQAKTLIRLYNDLKSGKASSNTLLYGSDLIIDPIKRKVFLREAAIELTRKEFDLLYFMASHPGQVFTRDQLYSKVWNADYTVNVDDSVKAHIKTLRRKLLNTDYIQNVWGVGYRFNPQ